MIRILSVIILSLLTSLTVLAQDRPEPFTIMGYSEQNDKELSEKMFEGTRMHFLEMPSMMGELSLCYSLVDQQLIAKRMYRSITERRGYPLDSIRSEVHRLPVADNVEELINDMLGAAVGCAAPKAYDDGSITLDGTTLYLFCGEQKAKISGHGERCKRLSDLLYEIYKAVREESPEQLKALVPRIEAMRREFRGIRFPADYYTPQTQHFTKVPQGYVEETAVLSFFRMAINLNDTVVTAKHDRDSSDAARKKSDAHVSRLLAQYGKGWEELAHRLYVETHILDEMRHPLTIEVVSEDQPVTLDCGGGFTIKMPESQIAPERLAKYLDNLDRLMSDDTRIPLAKHYLYDKEKGWR